MKSNQMYLSLSVVTALAVLATSLGALSFAQVVTPVSCSVASSTVSTNQAAIFTATGGNGAYSWSGTNLNVTNSAGTQFAVSYPNPGTYTVTVTSGGTTANCSFNVVAASTGTLVCSPAAQSVVLGQTASVTAAGGTGTYVWSSPELSITNPNGTGFSASYATAGLKTLTVTSGGVVATCAVNVLPNNNIPPVIPPVTPGLPNTGGGFNQ